jgi:hypothetical protein
MRGYNLNRPRSYDGGAVQAVCGLPKGHKRSCLTEEALQHWKQYMRLRDNSREARRVTGWAQ